ncbi:MAG: MFS transporter [Gammaproteobacteria bacterium]|nr:MFS transporter [Gammaproteobacteria bacterium]
MNRMKQTVWMLSLSKALMMTGGSLFIATAALVGARLAPDSAYATLPVAMLSLAIMLTTIPASFLMKAFGRRAGFAVGAAAAMACAVLASYAIVHSNFWYFCIAAALLGVSHGFGMYYRFAAADVATDDYRSAAISYVMAGGVAAALIGPNLARWTHDWFPATEFAGSYLSLVGVYTLSFAALFFMHIPRPSAQERLSSGRPLRAIAAQPTFIVALLGGALGYAVMSLVMTATPLAMHEHAHSFGDTAFVIEWHLLGMFAPSFFTGHLIRRFGVLNIMAAGALCLGLCVAVNFVGTDVIHFWLELTLLGIGWNFLFVGATTLLTETYSVEEKAKVQALNDFLVFTCVTAASFSAGALQHLFGWRGVNLGVMPLIVIILVAVVWLKQTRKLQLRAEGAVGVD